MPSGRAVPLDYGDGEAVLARNVEDDRQLGSQDSKGEIHSTGVICAPIRRGKRAYGLIHLYSTQADRVPSADDLEFTLAVADTVAEAAKCAVTRLCCPLANAPEPKSNTGSGSGRSAANAASV